MQQRDEHVNENERVSCSDGKSQRQICIDSRDHKQGSGGPRRSGGERKARELATFRDRMRR